MNILKKITSYIWKYKWQYFLAVASLVIATSLDMISPVLTRKMIDEVIIGKDLSIFVYLLLGFLGIGVGRCIFGYIKEYTFDSVSNKISMSIRRDLFKHIQSLGADFFDRTGTGELMSRIKDDVDRVWDGLGFVGMLLIEVVYHTGIVLFCMTRINLKLTVIPFVAMLFCGCIAIVMERRLGQVYEDISEENAQLNTIAEENLGGVRCVKSFAREDFEIKKFMSHNKKYYDLNMKQSRIFVKFYPMFSLISKILPVVVLLFGGHYVMDGNMTLGELSAFVEYSMNIIWPMEMLGWLTNCFSSALASNKKIRKLFAEKPSIVEDADAKELEEIKGNITFENVSFCKADEKEILKDISFEVKSGQTLGIMGATGAGKTSIVQLLLRMYDVTKGSIKIDGEDVRKMKIKQLRSSVAYVMQDVFLFSDTISENIVLGRKNKLDDSVIEEAAQDALANSFIDKLEDRYDTVIGERGVGLSGGQKQRLSIARALAKNNPILVMDDSTSALDMETEHEIQNMLSRKKDITKIIIAHRISAVKDADEIIILDDGCVKERGTHEELMRLKGLYYETYLSQYESAVAS